MAESVLDLILRIRKSGSGGKDAAKEFDTLKKGVGGAVKSLTGFDIASLTAAAGIAAVGAAAVGAVKETLAWAGAIDKLSRNTGLSTEEASKLAIVAGDVGIEIGTLEKSLKELNKDGLELNFETLKKVSKEYNATADPVKRLKIATDAFGKSAMDMTELLTRTPAELDALGESAQRSGRIMSGEAVAAAEKFETSLKQLQDRGKGLQVTFGNAVIPTLDAALNSFSNINKGLQAAVVSTLLYNGAISQEEAELRLAAIAAGDYYAAFKAGTPEVEMATESTVAITNAMEGFDRAADAATIASTELAAATAAVTLAELDAKAAAELANGVYGAATSILAASNVPLAEKLRLEEALALASGAVTQEELDRQHAIEALTASLSAGVVTEAEYLAAVNNMAGGLANARREAELLAMALNNMPSGGSGTAVETGGRMGGEIGFASGGSFVVPPGFPNDSYPMRVSSGEQVTVAPANQITNHYWGGGYRQRCQRERAGRCAYADGPQG